MAEPMRHGVCYGVMASDMCRGNVDTRDSSGRKDSNVTKRLAQIELGAALAAAGLALVTSIFFLFALLGQRQVCYGMRADKLLCQSISLATAARFALVVVTVLAFFAGGAIGAWFHQRAKDGSGRGVALGVLATCAVFVVCMVLPALNGPGLFLLPSTALLLVAAALGLYPALRETWQEVRGTLPSVK